MDALSRLLVGAAIFFVLAVIVVLMNKKENSNLRKDGSSYLNQVNPLSDVLPIQRDTSYPLPPHPVTGEPRPLGNNVLSENIDDTNKIPETFTTWFDQNAANAMSAMALYARGSSSRGSYGVNTGYTLRQRAFVDATGAQAGTTPIKMYATVANTTNVNGGPNGTITQTHVLPTGRTIIVPIPANTVINQEFTYNAPMRISQVAANRADANAAMKSGGAFADAGGNIINADIGELPSRSAWMGARPPLFGAAAAAEEQMAGGINSMDNPTIQYINEMHDRQTAPPL